MCLFTTLWDWLWEDCIYANGQSPSKSRVMRNTRSPSNKYLSLSYLEKVWKYFCSQPERFFIRQTPIRKNVLEIFKLFKFWPEILHKFSASNDTKSSKPNSLLRKGTLVKKFNSSINLKLYLCSWYIHISDTWKQQQELWMAVELWRKMGWRCSLLEWRYWAFILRSSQLHI